jgi:hypothetical protein
MGFAVNSGSVATGFVLLLPLFERFMIVSKIFLLKAS